MSLLSYPDHEYSCPRVDHCPHLGGAALGSVVYAAAENRQWTDSLQDCLKYTPWGGVGSKI